MRVAFVSAIAASLASLATAVVTPTGSGPSGNAIVTPTQDQVLPDGVPFTIKWTPSNTTADTVTLLLLAGPDDAHLVALPAPLVQSYPNIGTYDWTPDSTLGGPGITYGIELVDELTGAYQYSPRFTISNSNPTNSTSNSTVTTTSSSSSSSSSSASSSSTASSNSTITVVTPTLAAPTSLGGAATSVSSPKPSSSSNAAAKVVFSSGSLLAAVGALGFAL